MKMHKINGGRFISIYNDVCNIVNFGDKSSCLEILLTNNFIPEPTARSAVRRGLLIPLGYLHPGKSEHSEVKSPSMIAGASLWFVVHGWSSH